MTDSVSDITTPEDQEVSLRARVEQLERESNEIRIQAEQRLVLAEMKVEALRAGMLDLDGLKFLDLGQIQLDSAGAAAGGATLISQLKHNKPWLFSTPMSSSVAKVPPSRSARQKLATEMTDEEYRVARANIIKRQNW